MRRARMRAVQEHDVVGIAGRRLHLSAHQQGVLVQEVIGDTPADEAGLQDGDIILEFDGRSLDDIHGLTKAIRRADPGDEVILRIWGKVELDAAATIDRAGKLALDYELARQARTLDAGDRIRQVTMGWDERHGQTVEQRSKETSEDYRYFPEPDLPPLRHARDDRLRGHHTNAFVATPYPQIWTLGQRAT